MVQRVRRIGMTGQEACPTSKVNSIAARGEADQCRARALLECKTCGHLMPTAAGQAKVDCNVSLGVQLFLGKLP